MNLNLLNQLIYMASDAGEAIMSFQKKPTKISIKSDNTPVTEADRASNLIITKTLKRLTPNIPILSEESSEIPYLVRKKWKEYWLIDPLDGTRDFIDGSPDFCISIALIKDNYPSFGLIYSPLNKTLYYRLTNKKSIKVFDNVSEELCTQKPKRWENIVIGRYSNNNKDLKNHLKLKSNFETFKLGSALKFCLIAEGKYHCYPKFGRCSEWDTAAGVYILEGAGGKVVDLTDKRLKYNSTEDTLSPAFIAFA